MTALDLAIMNDSTGVARALIEAGANTVRRLRGGIC